MPGMRLAVIPKETFNFLSVTASNSSPRFLLGKAVDARNAREATLLVRVHSYTIVQAGASFTVGVMPSGPSCDDPTLDFIPLYSAATTVTINNTVAQPTLLMAAVPVNFGSYLRVFVVGTQAAIVGTLTASLSVDLSLKQ